MARDPLEQLDIDDARKEAKILGKLRIKLIAATRKRFARAKSPRSSETSSSPPTCKPNSASRRASPSAARALRIARVRRSYFRSGQRSLP